MAVWWLLARKNDRADRRWWRITCLKFDSYNFLLDRFVGCKKLGRVRLLGLHRHYSSRIAALTVAHVIKPLMVALELAVAVGASHGIPLWLVELVPCL